MPAKFTNNAYGTLASSITNTATTISLTSGNGARFPSLGAGEFFYATLVDSSNNLEIIQVTARSTDSLTVVRGQDGTSGRAYSAGDRLELRPVAAVLTNMVQLDGAQTVSGNKTFSGTNTHSGTNSFTGSVSFTNTITGSVSGNAGTVTNGVYTTGTQTIGGAKTFSQDVNVAGAVFRTSASGSGYLVYGNNGATNSGLYYDQTNSEVSLWTVSSKRFWIDSSGNATCSGTVTSNSDERLKSNIRTIEGALDSVKALRGTSYVKDGVNQIGVIAQEVQQVFPEVVLEGADGYLSVAYGNLVGVLIEAVKELSAKVERLEGAK